MTVDARAMAAECARAVEACESPTRCAVLRALQKLWIELGEKERLLSEQEESLNDAWADTTTAHGRLMLTILGGLAEFERELILARTSDGRTRAKARGVRFGRPPSLKRRYAGRSCSDLWRQPSHDIAAASIGNN